MSATALLPQFQPSVNGAHSRVVVHFDQEKPGFSEKAGLLDRNALLARNTLETGIHFSQVATSCSFQLNLRLELSVGLCREEANFDIRSGMAT